MKRRDFLGYLGAVSLVGCHQQSTPRGVDEFALVDYPEKKGLRLLTDRPPQLETPLDIFRQDITPNEAFYVRWHLSGIPTAVDADAHRLKVAGQVSNPLSLSLEDLRKKFKPVTLVAVNQCSGNQRGFFEPRVPGGQWLNGALGCAEWTGVLLKDLLEEAKVGTKAVEVTFQGLDRPPSPTVADFVKSLPLAKALDGEVMVAYAMNGQPLPVLNGFPIRLVVPGWYATYWVKALDKIQVIENPFDGFWMKTAYRIPNNPDINEKPDDLAKETVPINRMKVHSFFVNPAPGDKIPRGKPFSLEGLVTHGGGEVKSVEVSTDDGQAWTPAVLDASKGEYAWRRFRLAWTPAAAGAVVLRVRATMDSGESQKDEQWNRSGYARNVVERVAVVVE